MGTPAAYLPPALSADRIGNFMVSIGFPPPTSIRPLKAAAQFHLIYLITYAPDVAKELQVLHKLLHKEEDGSLVLVLRVAGRHLPSIKTLNEIGVMTWIKKNTDIPIPIIVGHDASEGNLLGHEYTLLEKVAGVSVDTVYDTLSPQAKEHLVDQLIVILAQLHKKSFQSYVGGLVADKESLIDNGPIVDEYFWQLPDIEKYWNNSETIESLNPVAPKGYTCYTDFITASIQKYIYAIERHDSLERFRDLIPRLHAVCKVINSPAVAPTLNNVKYILAHKDLHFGNIMCEPAGDKCHITAILDWEFSGVVPAPRWNPPRAFLWNTQDNEKSKIEQATLEEMFTTKCLAMDLNYLVEEVKLTEAQAPMQTLTNFLRGIVEVCPRGQAQDKVDSWKATVVAQLEHFGV